MRIMEFTGRNIAQTCSDWILYSGINDLSAKQQVLFNKEFPGLEQERLKLYTIVKPDGDRAWVPGSLKTNTNLFSKKILFCCINQDPNGASSYDYVRTVYNKIANNYQKLNIDSIATPLIGSGYGLKEDVISSYIGLAFDNSTPEKIESSFDITMYRY